MAETKQIAPAIPVTPDVYRPLSGLAVAAFIVAVLYSLLMIIVAVVALTKGIPLFMALWTLIVPIAGAVLAYLARRQIRTSEGVFGGLALTTWAWWLCLCFGMGYLAYYVGTRLAVTWQAKDFTARWFETLRKGDVNRAFMDTLAPIQRKGERVADLERYAIPSGRRDGPLTMFRQLDIVRTLADWKQDSEVIHVGVKNWEYDKGGYIVTQTYRVKTPESEAVYDIAVQSAEGPELEGRQWQIVRERLLVPTHSKSTDFGQTTDRWRQQARVFAGEWLRKRFNGNTLGAFLDTVAPADRDERQREFIAVALNGFASQPGAGLANVAPQLLAGIQTPAFREYQSGKLLSMERMMAPQNIRADLLAAIEQEFPRSRWGGVRLIERKPRMQLVDKANGPARVYEEFEWAILSPNSPPNAPPKFTIDAGLVLESDVGPVTDSRTPQWRITGIQLIRGQSPSVDGDRPF